jgi:chromosomal replication initiator protein
VSKDDKDIVSAVRACLRERLGEQRYEAWFGPLTELSVGKSALAVRVPSQVHQDLLRRNFRDDLEAACLIVFGEPLAVEFQVDEQLAAASAERDAEAPPAGESADRLKPAPTQPPAFSRRRFSRFEEFEVGPGNRLAVTAAQLAADQPGGASPLFLHGTTGVGKTHLLEAIWIACRTSPRRPTALYLSAEQFTTHFLTALHGQGLPSFRAKVRGASILLLDDVQFFAGKRATLVELLHTVDTLVREGRQVVLAADRSPAQLKAIGPELAARLAGGMVCSIEAPDHATRVGIVGRLAARLGMNVPDDVRSYLATHFTSHARELAGALKRLQASSLASGAPIGRALAEEALADLVEQSRRPVQLVDIQKAVVETFGLSGESLQSGDKSKAISHPRMLAMWLARKHTRAALTEIGRYFGRRSHTTVISATRKIESLIGQGGTVQMADRDWKLEDALRRVEQRLQAG